MKPLIIAGIFTLQFLLNANSQSINGDPNPSNNSIINGNSFRISSTDPLNSLSLVDGNFLERSLIRELSETFRVMANVTVADSVDSGFLIRGINAEGIGLASGNALSTIYIDGIAQSKDGSRRGSLSTWDLKDISVLRGPQGTLGGKNSLAGHIEIETNDPTFHHENSSFFGLSNNSFYESAFMVSGPINDQLAVRLSADSHHKNGEFSYPIFEEFPTLKERQEDHYFQIRGKLLYQPSGPKGASAILSASHSYDSPQYQEADGPSAGVKWSDRVWGLQTLPVFVPALSTEVSQMNLSVTIPISDYWSIESLTGIVRTITETPSVNLASQGEINESDMSQEFKAHYENESLKADIGLYFLDGDIDQSLNQNLPFNDFENKTFNENSFENLAFYGETSFQILPRLSLFGGFRYDHEKLEFSSTFKEVSEQGLLSSKKVTASSSDDAILPKIGIAYELETNKTLGLKAQKSYRPGSIAYDRFNDLKYEYESEKAWNYELSLNGSTKNKILKYSANLFYLDWQEQQISIAQIPGDISTALITNAEQSQVYGGELEIQATPTKRLSLFASVGIAITEFENFQFTQFRSTLDFSGEKFPHSPDYTAAVGIDYQFDNGFFFGADMKYTSSSISRSVFEGLEKDELPGYTVANLRAGYRKDNWSITAFISNATDEEYFLYRYDTPKLQVGTLGLERFCGLRASYTF
ncbi:TonB-dependent receptor [Verrucomicrobiales bacterium]|nr:TonB-dependent receptor [Verrucomicrobiales bacterium]